MCEMEHMQDGYSIERVREILRDATGPEGGFSRRGLSAKAGLAKDAVADIINGRNNNPSAMTLDAIASAMGEDLSIFGLSPIGAQITPLGPRLNVIASVAAGVWKEAWQWDEDDWLEFTGRADSPIAAEERFGLRPDGDSMNLAYPPGTIIECAAYKHDHVIKSGRRVVVQRQRATGEYETTVKELVRDEDGVEWLVPRSSNPAFSPFRADAHDPDIIHCEIIAVVIGSYRPED